MDKMKAKVLRYLIHHIVLPPELPQEDDWSASNEQALLNHAVQAFRDFCNTLVADHAGAAQQIASVVQTIENMIHCSANGCISEMALAESIRRLAAGHISGTIPLRVNEQNAGIIISRTSTNILFEVFELSPLNSQVMSTSGRLIRTFPTYASEIPAIKFQEEGLAESLAHSIAEMCANPVPDFQPKASKGGKKHVEIRDTTHPALVTEFLIGVLSAIGQPAIFSGITKHTREDVLWSDTLHPWRRSPSWLLVRVATQIQLSRHSDEVFATHGLFKASMVHVLTKLLDAATVQHKAVGMDFLHTVSVKLDRRLRKLKASQNKLAYSLCAKSALSSLANANRFMKNSWECIMRAPGSNIDMADIATLEVEGDLDLNIPKLDQIICQINARSPQPVVSKFVPGFAFPKLSPTELPELSYISGESSFFQLAGVEKWVQDHLSSWLDRHIGANDSCERLGSLIKAYHKQASSTYSEKPRNISIMYLTIMELWVACDKCACHCHVLIPDYNPEVDVECLRSLSLPFKNQMKRLDEIERYIGSRCKRSVVRAPSLFRDFGHPTSFGVRYYDGSLKHQTLKQSIEQEATAQREQKKAELTQLKRQYQKLRAESDSLDCTYITMHNSWGDAYEHHEHSCCRKCILNTQAKNLCISIHEWPLPSNVAMAKAAIFELQVPRWFSRWRDTTRYLMISVLESTGNIQPQEMPSYSLQSQDGLYSRQQIPPGQHLMVVSKIKPVNRSHFKKKEAIIHVQNEDICLPNAMQYIYYDTISKSFPGVLGPTDNVKQNCSYQLPDRSKGLERYLVAGPSTGEVSPNSVISSISDSPHHFSVSEYKAFGAIPVGYNIQYMNILTQLAIPTVDFAKVETQCLMLQIIHQAGPPSDEAGIERVAHHILKDRLFCEAVLNNLETILPTLAKNWECWRGLATFVQLAIRIFELNSAEIVQDRCLAWLGDARRVALTWLNNLQGKARSSTDHKQRLDLMSQATEVALLCVSTFDVDEMHLDRILSEPCEASVLIQSSIVVQENQDNATSEHSHLLGAMMAAWRSFQFRVLPLLRNGILRHSLQDGLNEALKIAWSGFEPGLWQPFNEAHFQWIYLDCGQHKIHFDLLTAELLVNGIPLARLPREYVSHPTYLKLFKNSILEVMPSKEPGMSFSSKSKHHDHALSFGLSQQGQMLVVAAHDDNKYDLIPSESFQGVLPSAFISDFFYWYDHRADMVELRPRQNPWQSAADLWLLKKVQSMWQLVKGTASLVRPTSKTGKTLSAIFAPLEDAPHMHVTFLASSSYTIVSLPRLQLDFQLELGQSAIHSNQYRGMVIDPNQQFGTLIGLRNKLVLKHFSVPENRMVLIPEGLVSYTKSVDHVMVSIDANTVSKTHPYQIDATLGRLEDNGSLQSKLFLCYLHSLTSYFLPDDLTSHTGTESALVILRSAAVASFDVLTKPNINLLGLIADLTPKRSYYPDHLRVMQQVFWNSQLSFMVQHPELLLEVERIFTIYQNGQSLCPKEVFIQPPTLKFGDTKLLERYMISSSIFRVDGFGGECFARKFDIVYQGRENHSPNKGRLSFITASLILREQSLLHSEINARRLLDSLRNCHLKDSKVLGPSRAIEPNTLKYSAKWLYKPSTWLPELWCRLHASLPIEREFNKYDIIMWLSTAAFAKNADMDLIQALIAFYRTSQGNSVAIPGMKKYDLGKGDSATCIALQSCISTHKRNFHGSPESMLPRNDVESNKNYTKRRTREFERNQQSAIDAFVSALLAQWPCRQPSKPTTGGAKNYIHTEEAMQSARTEFEAWYNNRTFYQYLELTTRTLQQNRHINVAIQSNVIVEPQKVDGVDLDIRSYLVESIFALPPPVMRSSSINDDGTEWPVSPNEPILLTEETALSEHDQSKERLAALCHQLDLQAQSSQEKQYVLDLRKSCNSLSDDNETLVNFRTDLVASLRSYASQCSNYFTNVTKLLEDLVKSTDDVGHLRQCPRIGPVFWLRQLNKRQFDQLSPAWRVVIVRYGLAVTQLQRARRLLAVVDHPRELAEELRNRGHQNWDPDEFPETLLLEAESGILVRSVQESIARYMRQPPNGDNAVMQLNMGEGKTTVIVPMTAAALANGHTLVRVVVAKPQSKQMLEMLIAKLGGLLGRRIYHMPFSRASRPSLAEANALAKIYRDCMQQRGILLVQPEHILSFKMMCIESLITGNEALGRSLLGTQQFFDEYSRDIVDESDENFSVKFELVYTMGAQRTIELSPERWNIVHIVLSLVCQIAKKVRDRYRSSIEVDDDGEGRYPRIRILRGDAEDMLLDLLARQICKRGSSALAINRLSDSEQDAILRYVRHAKPSSDDIEKVETGKSWAAMKDTLMLLRGLIAGGVLRFVLRFKRWRVNYGLDCNRLPRTKLAVPYRSKDSPSPRSEFSHPEVIIALTSLTYYYGGMSDEELFDTFAHLAKSDQKDAEYDEWVRDIKALPQAFRLLSGVNIKDHEQCTKEVFPFLRFSKGAIDYFLSHTVFPKEMKEFPQKISASGWDLAALKPKPTTGFSGTNDSRHVLPLTIRHLDLQEQKHTNALVLAYLLQDENSVILLPKAASKTSTAETLLKVVNEMDANTRVILDVGAQILELNNLEVADTWLSLSNRETSRAVVFFDDNEELSVLDRSGRVEPLQTSAFAKHLEDCLIYLDEAHTRGTNLKLPKNYRAAVTLGANVTKDRLVQACMRMRKLGKGQSVVFCISEEIQGKITERTSRSACEIQVSDVLTWAITETWSDLRRSIPLWATQGQRYERHKYLLNGLQTTVEQAEQFLEEEAQTVEHRYRPRINISADEAFKGWDISSPIVEKIIQRCKDFDTLNFDAASLQEEQERELAPEIEEERQLERPPPMSPEKHKVHPHLTHLVRTGQLIGGSMACVPAFQALQHTGAAKCFDVKQLPTDLLVTHDFIRTVKRPKGDSLSFNVDLYLRPVQWVLSFPNWESANGHKHRLLVISPFEADQLLHLVRTFSHVTLHLYAPRPNQVFQPLDNLDLFQTRHRACDVSIINRSLIVQLNLFAGQLYFNSYGEYKEMCDYLGLAWTTVKEGQEVQTDGFVRNSRGKWGLKDSAVRFFRELMKLRREGEGIDKTHIGRLLNGIMLTEEDFTKCEV